jgi:hypothetical protein
LSTPTLKDAREVRCDTPKRYSQFSAGGFYTALSSERLGPVYGATDRVSWRVQVLTGRAISIGVCFQEACGISAVQGLTITSVAGECWCYAGDEESLLDAD